jgi:hypothetical protein
MTSDVAAEGALRWLGWLFNVPQEAVRADSEFGSDLKSSFESDFSENELATVSEEVLYIRRCVGDNLSMVPTIRTVGDFCALVERYQSVNPSGCRRLLARWNKQIGISSKPTWRRVLYKALGI